MHAGRRDRGCRSGRPTITGCVRSDDNGTPECLREERLPCLLQDWLETTHSNQAVCIDEVLCGKSGGNLATERLSLVSESDFDHGSAQTQHFTKLSCRMDARSSHFGPLCAA